MAVLSKFTDISLPYNCYEAGHTWHPDCNFAAFSLGAAMFNESIKVYFPLYVLSMFLKRQFSLDSFSNILTNTFISSAFLGFHGFGIIFFSCTLRKLLGRIYFLTYFFIPTLITSFLGIFIERKNRRLPLAIYVTYVATETLLRMAAARGIVKPVPNAEVYLFCVVIAINLYVAKKYGYSNDIISSIFKFIFGDKEAKQKAKSLKGENIPKRKENFLLQKILLWGTQFKESVGPTLLENIPMMVKHPSCCHDYNCILYCLQGFCRPFLIGYAALSVSRCFSFGKKLFSHPALLFSLLVAKRTLSLGLFLGGFGATFRFINCLLRWCFAKDLPVSAIPSALLGGLFMKFFPSSTIALYLMWKTIENGYLEGMDKGVFPHVRCFVPLLYSFSTAVLLHTAVMEAHNLKPSYLKFVGSLTQKRIIEVNHYLLDIFGTQASKMFPNFWPETDYQYTSSAFRDIALLWLAH